MKRFQLVCSLLFLMILYTGAASAQYNGIRIESQEEALERQIEIARLKKQLEDIKRGKTTSDYPTNHNTNPHLTFTTEVHPCSNNGYHNTGYEHNCFDLYFYPDGTVYWDRRRYQKVRYNDQLYGHYFLQQAGRNRYDLHITWDNGAKLKGRVTYERSHPQIKIGTYVFPGK